MTKLGFERIIDFNRTFMKLTGVWPDSTSNWSFMNFLASCFIIIFFTLIPQTYKFFLVKDNLNDAIEVLTTADLMLGIACFKLVITWYNKRGKVKVCYTVM